MGPRRLPSADRDGLLYQVISDYLESSERGGAPDPEELAARHPRLGSELREFLKTHELLERLTAPVRRLTREFHPPGR